TNTPWLRWIAVSFTVIIAIVGGVSIGNTFLSTQGEGGIIPQVASQTLTTLRGPRAQFQLPDGSTVLLGPDTRLRYSHGMGQQQRLVELSGEAMFTVTHATGAPFIVRTQDALVRVLGTTFTVLQYTDESQSRVVVSAGRVSVAPESGAI